MADRELIYYKSKLDELAGELLQKEYAVALLTNESLQLQNGFSLLLSLGTELYKSKEIKSFATACCERTMRFLSLDGVIIFNKSDDEWYRLIAYCGNESYVPEQITPVASITVTKWFGQSNSLLINAKSKLTGAGSEICDWSGFPFCLATLIAIDSDEFILFGGRRNERKPLRHLPLSQTDIFIFESVASLFATLVGRLKFGSKMEEERNRISRDMHDNIGSDIAGISMLTDQLIRDGTVENKSRLETIKSRIGTVIEHLGNTIWLLNSGNDKLEDFVAYLRSYSNRIAEETVTKIVLTDDGIEPFMLISREKRHHLFMVFKEALHNIRKYARASEIKISILQKEKALEMTIEDDGIGYEKERTFGNGLKNMRKRIDQCKGIIRIYSSLGNGTKLFVSVNPV